MAYLLASRLATRRLLGIQTINPLFAIGSRAGKKKAAALGKPPCVQNILQRPDETHDDKNYRLGRPLSPHLSVYKIQLTSVLSILHRITGTIGGAYLVIFAACALYVPYDLCTVAEYIECMNPPMVVVWLARSLVAFPYVYHSCNGVRHLVWDTGNFLNVTGVFQTGMAMLATFAVSMIVVVFVL